VTIYIGRYLIIFRYPDGGLAFYRIEGLGGRFTGWAGLWEWSHSVPGQIILNYSDETLYRLTLERLSPQQAADYGLRPLQPQEGDWYEADLFNDLGIIIERARFFVHA